MPNNFYELLWIFLIYAFLGWCMEVAYAAVNTGKFVNRGFLNGPYCPIYGTGIVIVVYILTPLKENLFILFMGSFLLTSVLEFLTGFLLEKIFHNKWWDYSNLPFNIKGYVCLKFSLYWGIACTFVMDSFHPLVYKFIKIIPHILGIILLVLLCSLFLADICVTVATILNLNKHLRAMNEIAKKLHQISDGIGEKVYENVTNVLEKSEEFQDSHEEIKTRWEEKSELEKERLQAKYKELMEKKHFGVQRMLTAFPNMKSREQNDILQKYKENIRKNIKNKTKR